MQPIVDRLQEIYADRVLFVDLNAVDHNVGQAAFEELSLPGHPSYVLFTPDGEEQFRSFGVVEPEILRTPIDEVLAGG